MKIGILTFHWGTNFGGVLQAFALQNTIKELGFNVEIINYAPISHRDFFIYIFNTKRPADIWNFFIETVKEKKFRDFRDKYLYLSPRYTSFTQLEKVTFEHEILISGSDQVWNPYSALNYGKPYFLSFTKKSKKIAYAVSLGCENYPRDILNQILPLIRDFDIISVRENTAMSVLEEIGIKNVSIMPDPTLLLNLQSISKLISIKKKEEKFVFFYILQRKQKQIYKYKKLVEEKYEIVDTTSFSNLFMNIEDWLGNIFYSKFVITNSFHGVVFSLLLHKNFIVIPIEGNLKGMNDRIYTLLDKFKLKNKIINVYNPKFFYETIYDEINWDIVDTIREELKEQALLFLIENLKI